MKYIRTKDGHIYEIETKEFYGSRIGHFKNASNDFNLKNPKENILLGVTYIIYLSNKFDCQSTLIAAYNAGEGNVSNWLKNKAFSNDGKSLDVIPFNETKIYLNRVLTYKKTYEILYRLN